MELMNNVQWTMKIACTGLVVEDVFPRILCSEQCLREKGTKATLRLRTQTRYRHLQVSPYMGSHFIHSMHKKYDGDSDGLGERTR